MRTRFFLLLPLLLMALPTHAAQPHCDGPPVDSSLPDKARAEKLANRAFACLKEAKPLQSIALFSEFIGVQPDNAQAHLNRGSTYVRMGQLDAGLSDYSRVIELEPTRFEGWYNRGSTRVASRQYDEAISDLTEAIRLKPDLAYAYCNRGLSYLRKSENEEALADFEKGLALRVDMPLCYYGRGEFELSDGKYREAIEDLTRGINFKPTAEALAHRATAYERLGESDKALRDYRQALSLRPRFEAAQTGIARLTQNNKE
ncbi:MAG TPA: tetratricopeptide repeat protein [Methyloceanibacter sp.]|nr:tetratricopeptide repeat protein [Methyloceanibacter sp.]